MAAFRTRRVDQEPSTRDHGEEVMKSDRRISLASAYEKYPNEIRESRRTILRLAALGQFPPPINPRAARLEFVESQIDALAVERRRQRGTDAE
jgi:hypothetical protein